MPARPIPALRRDLEVQERRGSAVEVRDARLQQIYTVEREDWLVAEAFDGRRDARAVAALLADRRALSPSDVEALAADFERLHLLDTAKARRMRPTGDTGAAPSQLRAGAPLDRPLALEPGARWACHACGACCHNLAVELSEADDARIERRLYADLLGDEDYAEEQFVSPREPARRVLRQDPERGHRCVFLLDDGRCAIHARQGMAAKPHACQSFPLMAVRVPYRAPRLGLRINCPSMGKSFESGPALDAQLAQAERIFAQVPLHKIPARLQWFGAEIGFAAFERITDELGSALALDGLTAPALVAVDRRLLGGRVRRRRRRWATELARYVAKESSGELPAGEGAFRLLLRKVPRSAEVLRAMAAGAEVPAIEPAIERFLRAQLGHVLWLGGPLLAPDAGLGLVAVMIALEAAMHAARTVDEAAVAFDVFASPVLETPEHMWPVLDALEPAFAKRVREEMR